MGKKSRKGNVRTQTQRPAAGQGKSKHQGSSLSGSASRASREDLSVAFSSENGTDAANPTTSKTPVFKSKKPTSLPKSVMLSPASTANETLSPDGYENNFNFDTNEKAPLLDIPVTTTTTNSDVLAATTNVAPAATSAPVLTTANTVPPEPALPTPSTTTKTEVLPPNRVLILVSQQSMIRTVTTNQQNAVVMLHASDIPFELFDGSDPTNKDRRNELFALSGKRGVYPQFFVIEESKPKPRFWGDYETMEVSNENGTLAEDIFSKTTETAEKSNNNNGKSVWDSTLREQVNKTNPDNKAVLDVSIHEEHEEASKSAAGPVSKYVPVSTSRVLDLSAPAPDEAKAKQKDCECVIL
jgi:hypothetical protein|uniref:Uncharacterized protein n=1 Tax=Phaeodactylum tricornutum TaxID=2850 RepID=A0A8J9S2C5_PHATR